MPNFGRVNVQKTAQTMNLVLLEVVLSCQLTVELAFTDTNFGGTFFLCKPTLSHTTTKRVIVYFRHIDYLLPTIVAVFQPQL